LFYCSIFSKVNELNEYIKSSVKTNANGEINPYLVSSTSGHLKEVLCKNASAELEKYKNAMKTIILSPGKNELYDYISSYLSNVEKYIASCNAWAEFLTDKSNAFDIKAVIRQLDYIDKPLKAMGNDERSIRAFLNIYKKRNGL